jgi:hypothetical protein
MRRGMTIRRGLLFCGLLASIALVGGADRLAASTTTHCNQPDPTGREFCVTIQDLDGVSPTGVSGSGPRQVAVTAYQYYKFTIENKGGSTLTNGVVTLVLTDRFFTGDPANSKAMFVPSGSASFCSSTKANPNTVTCSLASIPAGGLLTFTVGYRTSDAANVKETVAAVTAGFKEGAKKGANPAALPFTEITSLEPDPEKSVAWSPPGQEVSLGTSSADEQFSILQYKVPADKTAFEATLTESNGFVCHPEETCFGELVTTDLPDPTAFSASNAFHLRIAVSLDIAPGGPESGYVVSHRLDDNTFEVLTQPDDTCSANPPTSTEALPCFIVDKDNQAKLLIFDIYAFENGGWMPG